MKKLILSTICAVLSGTAVLADPVSATVNTTLTLSLDNVITISEQFSSMGAHFANAADYANNMALTSNGNGAEIISVSTPSSNIMSFTVQSNRYFNITAKAASANMSYTAIPGVGNAGGDHTTMPVSVIQYNCYASPSAGGGIAHANIPLSASNQQALDGVKNGPAQMFYMSFVAQPKWNYAGGAYATTVTITATQE